MVEHYVHNDQIYAIIIRASFSKSGIEFFTPNDFSQQLGYMNRPRGYKIEPHRHNHIERHLVLTQEVLLIRSGTVRVDFYDSHQAFLESRVLVKGDVILLAAGGHGFEMLEDAEIIEVKQGPYSGTDDKIRFENSRQPTIPQAI